MLLTAAQSELAQRAADTGRERRNNYNNNDEINNQQKTKLDCPNEIKIYDHTHYNGKLTKFNVVCRCNIDIV